MKRNRTLFGARAAAALVLMFMVGTQTAFSQWRGNGVSVSSASGDQSDAVTIADGFGGTIHVWIDTRNGNPDIFAQRLNADGEALWATDGVPVCTDPAAQSEVAALSDGTGGVIAVWRDQRIDGGDIYGSRLIASGTLATIGWLPGGSPIANSPNVQSSPQIATDGGSGVIIVWSDQRNGVTNADIYGVRLNANYGLPGPWVSGGISICNATNNQINPRITSAGLGATVIVWQDFRSGNSDIYAVRIDVNGAPTTGWAVNGDAISTAAFAQTNPQIGSDGVGGAIMVWESLQNGNSDIYATRFDIDGNVFGSWASSPVCTNAADQFAPRLSVDAANSRVAFTWEDLRNGNLDIFGTVYNFSGGPVSGWTPSGEAICAAPQDQEAPDVILNNNGAVFTWTDNRTSVAGAPNIFAQRVSTGSTPLWVADGAIVCKANLAQGDARIVSPATGQYVIAWTDTRFGGGDIYAQRIGDYVVTNQNATGAGTLAQAVIDANAGGGVVWFAIPTSPPFTIPLSAPLTLTGNNVLIDGYTQFDAVPNTLTTGSNAVPIVELDCATPFVGINISGQNAVIRGLTLYNNPGQFGIVLQTGTVNTKIEGCFIGVRADGVTPDGFSTGIRINDGLGAVIGGNRPFQRNVISANNSGVIVGGGTNTTIAGNIIGLDKAGTSDVGTQVIGVYLQGGAGLTLVGGSPAGQANLISGNDGAGIFVEAISIGAAVNVYGNIIGLDKTGAVIPSGTAQGSGLNLNILSGVSQNLRIGGTGAGEGNLISGNQTGIQIQTPSGSTLQNSFVQGNLIGTQIDGATAVAGNVQGTALISNNTGTTTAITVGDVGSGGANTIAYHTTAGIFLFGATQSAMTIGNNRFFSNVSFPIRLTSGANNNIAAPTVSSVSLTTISGTSIPNGTVRVFTDLDDEGRFFLGTTTANGAGNWSLTGTFAFSDYITATVTDAAGNTSQFSPAVVAAGGLAWTLSNGGIAPATALNDVAASPSAALLVGSNGRIYKSTNGGASWVLKTSGTSNVLNSISLPPNATLAKNSQGVQAFGTAISCGVGGTILRSTDGGETWINESGTTTNTLNDVSVSENFAARNAASIKGGATIQSGQAFGTAISCGVGGTILRSTDGGENWETENSGTTNTLNAVASADNISAARSASSIKGGATIQSGQAFGTAISCGVGGTILRSTDGGETWVNESGATTNTLNDVAVTSDINIARSASSTKGGAGVQSPTAFGTAISCGVGGTILRSIDGGENWAVVPSPTAVDLTGVWVVSATEAYITGADGVILKSIDGGATWNTQSAPATTDDLQAIVVLPTGQGFAVGANSTVFITNNAGDTPLPVELTGFTAAGSPQAVTLAWQTASETQNLGFMLLRAELQSGVPTSPQEIASYTTSPDLQGQGTTGSVHQYRFTDATVQSGKAYRYTLRSQDLSGTVHDYTLSADASTESVTGKPTVWKLEQNYPNPFNPQTTIRYSLKVRGQVRLELFNALGQQVRVLADGVQDAGNYNVRFSMSNFSSGTYFYRLSVFGSAGSPDGFTETRRMTLLK